VRQDDVRQRSGPDAPDGVGALVPWVASRPRGERARTGRLRSLERPRLHADAVCPSLPSGHQHLQLLRLCGREVVPFRAVGCHVVGLPMGRPVAAMLRDELPLAVTQGAVAMAFPGQRGSPLQVLVEHRGHEADAFHRLARDAVELRRIDRLGHVRARRHPVDGMRGGLDGSGALRRGRMQAPSGVPDLERTFVAPSSRRGELRPSEPSNVNPGNASGADSPRRPTLWLAMRRQSGARSVGTGGGEGGGALCEEKDGSNACGVNPQLRVVAKGPASPEYLRNHKPGTASCPRSHPPNSA
jgi:hypothetical protein